MVFRYRWSKGKRNMIKATEIPMVVKLFYQRSGSNVTQYSIKGGGPVGSVTKFGARLVIGYVGFGDMGY